jgi:hypothetical protein
MLQQPPQLGGAQPRLGTAHRADGPQRTQETAPIGVGLAEAQFLVPLEAQVPPGHGQQGFCGG